MRSNKFEGKDYEEAERLLTSKGVKQIVFSYGTYQVEVDDGSSLEPYWVFLQLDSKGDVQDCFCTCKKAEYTQSCPHLAAGYLAIYHSHKKPLHIRFEGSLWDMLFRMIAMRYGYEPVCLKKTDVGLYSAKSSGYKKNLELKIVSDEAILKIEELFEKPVETEENSIKFSNLTNQELQDYRRGNPSSSLLFELSFWSDFAKWLFFKAQDEDQITVKLKEDESGSPSQIMLKTAEIELVVAVGKEEWGQIIASLKPYLAVQDFSSFSLKEILYNEKKKSFSLIKEPSIFETHQGIKTCDLGEYSYVSKFGFFPKKNDPLFEQDEIQEKDVAYFLRHYRHVIDKYLSNATFHLTKEKAQYQLFFDDACKFHIELFIDKPGDIHQLPTSLFLPFAYSKKKGFFELKELFFEESSKEIAPNKMSEFIEHFKHWLNQYEGFQIHLTSLESTLAYELNPDDSLSFALTEQTQAGSELIDLGDWCYLKGFGFFSKTSQRSLFSIRPGTRLERDSIGLFIDQHATELEFIKNFFSNKPAIDKTGLSVFINESHLIQVEPKLCYRAGCSKDNVAIFGRYSFKRGEGFYPLGEASVLPKGYETKKIIPAYLEEQFIHFELEAIQKWIIEIDPKLEQSATQKLVVDALHEDDNKRFRLKLYYETAHGRIPFSDLYDSIMTSKTYVITKAGLIFLKEGKWDWVKTLSKKSFSKTSSELKISMLDWIKVSVFEKFHFGSNCNPETLQRLTEVENIEEVATEERLPDLTGFQSNLRPYQKVGLKWLWHLFSYDLSGILADDMGLGKTHQAMALLASVMNHNPGKKYLVVCPTSVIYHWQNLLKNFLPFARVMMFYGPFRDLAPFDETSDILLTSYGTLRSEIKGIQSISFEVSILDEMHVAKNQQSLIHKCLKKLDSKMKLGLTGTPIENDLNELKALFDIVLPQYFPDVETFKEQFILPIEKMDDFGRKDLLRKMIRPFVLRRKKTEVLNDLPEKIEEISYIELSDEQRALYKQIFEEKRLKMNDEEPETQENFYFHVFQLFNKLKQVCNHPALVLNDVENYTKYQSGKFELFKELIREARASNTKVVVFTQYLGMLEIMRHYLNTEKIGFASIQGNTRDRKEQIEKFKEDPSCEIFLASLQAAGVGIDLVSASVVIHYDRWWNPAKENQATDRVHRIGQTRGVQVFKFVSKDTIEEHIHNLIVRKLELAQSIVGYDDELEMKKIDRDELVRLLQLVHKDL